MSWRVMGGYKWVASRVTITPTHTMGLISPLITLITPMNLQGLFWYYKGCELSG